MRADGFPYLAPSLQEWLETDGLGGFASSTAAAIHTRRYHGWLFLAGREPGDRFLALSKLHDVAHAPQGDFDLSTSYYPGGLHPEGVKHQWSFRRYPFPAFLFKLGDLFLTREMFMRKGEAGVFCRYLLERRPAGIDGPPEPEDGGGDMLHEVPSIRLDAKPLCNDRSYHDVRRADTWSPRVVPAGPGVVLEGHSACGEMLMVSHGASFQADPRWYYNMMYPRERERGLDYTEDHFSPGLFTLKVARGSPAYFWAGPFLSGASVEEIAKGLPLRYEEARESELRRREALVTGAKRGAFRPGHSWRAALPGRLALAADQFVVRTGSVESIVAGYHWFGEWGRDSFVAMPGILLSSGRFEEARRVFSRFGDAVREGLVPNRFEEERGASYNSADASLWMIRALGKYEEASGDRGFVRAMIPAVEKIAHAYLSGTMYGVGATAGGLIRAGTPSTQVTWMDARVNEAPVTPREGCPVEVNALWVEGLLALARWTGATGRPDAGTFARLAGTAQGEFRRRFTWPGTGLYDRLTDEGPISEVRPNQVIAAGCKGVDLPESTLVDVWNTAVRRLLTPRGLRTLDPSSPLYRGTYRGGPAERDAAYHQGTAWPWLVGPLFDLALKLDGLRGYASTPGPFSRFVIDRALPGIVTLDKNPCIGSIFEVASGDWPYEPGGAVAQAWSVGEAARVINRAVPGNYQLYGEESTSADARMGVPSAPRGRPGAPRVPPWTLPHGSGRRGDGSHQVV